MSKQIILDIENVPMILADFSLYRNGMTSFDNILQDSFMVCVCWKELGKKKIHSVSLLDDRDRFKADPTDDYHVAKVIHELLLDTDLLIGHNIKNFDWKVLNTRFIKHRLPPIPAPRFVDTLALAKKEFKFASNKLDYIAQYLEEGAKVNTPKGLWLDTLRGDKKAIKTMVKYCKGDIEVSEDVYTRLRPYYSIHPNMATHGHVEGMVCPKCGEHDNLEKRGFQYTNTGKFQQYKCNSCNGWSKGRKNLLAKSLTGVSPSDIYLNSN